MFINYCYMVVGGSIFLVHNLWKYSLHFPRIASFPEFSFFLCKEITRYLTHWTIEPWNGVNLHTQTKTHVRSVNFSITPFPFCKIGIKNSCLLTRYCARKSLVVFTFILLCEFNKYILNNLADYGLGNRNNEKE